MKRIKIVKEDSYDEHLEFGIKENCKYGFFCRHEDNFEVEQADYLGVVCYDCDTEFEQIEYEYTENPAYQEMRFIEAEIWSSIQNDY